LIVETETFDRRNRNVWS